MNNHILLKDLAQELGMDRSHARRYVLKAGFSFLRVRTQESKGQLTLALSHEDAEAIKELRESQGYAIGKRAGKAIMDNGMGFFYIIQVVPDLEPGRVKLGFARDVDARLQSHRVAAPTAKLLRAWPSKRSWESATIASITREGCKALSSEVFAADNLNALIERGDTFFTIMPYQGDDEQ